MKEGEIKHQKAQEKIPSSRRDSNSDNPLEFSIGHFTTELLEWAGSKFNYYTPAREDCIRYLFKISCPPHLTTNRSFLRCLKPRFQSEARCKAIDVKIIFYSPTNKTTFTREVFHLASFWKWEFLKLGNDLAIHVKKSEQFVSVSNFYQVVILLLTPFSTNETNFSVADDKPALYSLKIDSQSHFSFGCSATLTSSSGQLSLSLPSTNLLRLMTASPSFTLERLQNNNKST